VDITRIPLPRYRPTQGWLLCVSHPFPIVCRYSKIVKMKIAKRSNPKRRSIWFSVKMSSVHNLRCITNAFRKIFNAYWNESVKPLPYYCSCFSVSILLPMKKLLFWKKMLCSGNTILCRLAKCCDASIFALAAKFHVVRFSITCIKDSF